jgi:hypothetical protein
MSLRSILPWLRYQVILAREIWLSAVTVTKLVLGPLDRLRSAFLAVPMEASSDIEITTLANSITLTPGTITVHVEPAQRLIVIHAIDIGQDPEDVRQSIKNVLEANILLWSRAGRRNSSAVHRRRTATWRNSSAVRWWRTATRRSSSAVRWWRTATRKHRP